MTRLLALIFCVAAAVSFLGCDKSKTFVNESKEGYRELEEIAGKLGQVISAVSTNDFAQAKELTRKLEPFLNTRVLSWTVQILATEEKEGVEAARAAIDRFRTSDGITAGEREALDKMQAFYRNKTGRTGDLLVIVAAIAVEEKFGGHGTGGVFIQICEKLRTQPTPGGASVTNATSTQ